MNELQRYGNILSDMCKHPSTDSHLFSMHQQHWKYRFLLHLFFILSTHEHNRVGGGERMYGIIRGNIWRIQSAHICSSHISTRAAYHTANDESERNVRGVMIQLKGAKVMSCSFALEMIARVHVDGWSDVAMKLLRAYVISNLSGISVRSKLRCAYVETDN